MSTPLSVALAISAEDRHRVARFRYRIEVEGLNRAPAGTDPIARTVVEPLDRVGHLIVLEAGDDIAATMRVVPGAAFEAPPALRDAFALDRFEADFGHAYVFSSALTVDPELSEPEAPRLLLGAAYKLAREHQARFDFCECAPALVPLYERLGFRQYTDNFVDEKAGYRVPMVLLVEDIGHLRAVRSPLAALAARYRNRKRTARWFAETFGRHIDAAAGDSDAFWHYLARRLHAAPERGIGVLDGLDEEDAQHLCSLGSVLRCRAGDTILRAGEVGEEMYVVLAGTVEVRVSAAGTDHRLAAFGPGQAFGEVGFLGCAPRSATVIATQAVEVLVLTREFLDRALDESPRATARLLMNLCAELSERLRLSNETLLGAPREAAA